MSNLIDMNRSSLRSAAKVFRRTLLYVFVPAFLFFVCDSLALFTSKKWNLAGFIMVLAADPWGTMWLDQGIAMGRLLGFSVRNAITTFLLPLFFALNIAAVASIVAYVWRMIRRPKPAPVMPID